jgi:hypothetical protein
VKRWIVLYLLLASCDHTVEKSEGHLRAMGYKVVACEGHELSTCTADDQHFHCAVANSYGCAADAQVACERYLTEKPAP